MLLKKAIELIENQDVNLTLIRPDKILGDVHKDSVKDIIPIAVKYGHVITFHPSSNPKRFDFEVFLDLPF